MIRSNKNIVLIFVFLWTISRAFSQNDNDWINFSQYYFKIPIAKEGIYRIDYNTLSSALTSAGEDPTTFNPQNFQMYARGKEIPIYVFGESDGFLHTTDYIEFYAYPNDAWLDTAIYENPQDIPNPHFSLYNDTIFYYLTWNSSTVNLRYTEYNNTSYPPSSTAVNYFLKSSLYQNPINYNPGWLDANNKGEPTFTDGEGFVCPRVDGANVSKTFTLNTPNIAASGIVPNAKLKTSIVSFSDPNDTSVPTDHHVTVKISTTTLIDEAFNDQSFFSYDIDFSPSLLSNSTTSIIYTNEPDAASATKTAPGYFEIIYPHSSDFSGESIGTYTLSLDAAGAGNYLLFNNISATNITYIYDITDNYRIKTTFNSNTLQALVPAGSGSRNIVFAPDDSIQYITNLTPVNSQNSATAGSFFDFMSNNTDSVMIIITHAKLWTEALQYASFKQSKGLNTVVADIEELYHQFGYGIPKHPQAIRNFCKFLYNNYSTSPSYLFLIGKSIELTDIRYNNLNYSNCLVPTIGYPSVDNLLTAGFSGSVNWLPAFPVGRLAAFTPLDVSNYLNKVQRYYQEQENTGPSALIQNIDNKLWMKKILHFGGGSGATQQDDFKSYLEVYENIIEDTLYGGYVTSIYKTSSQVIDVQQAEDIKALINSGSSIMTFFGHSSAQGFDLSVDDPMNYQNEGRCPLVIANGCYSGNIHLPFSSSLSVSEQFILAPNAAIGFLASSAVGYTTPLHTYSTYLYQNIAYKNYDGSIGYSILNTINEYASLNPANYLIKSVVLEMTLHGDPSLQINPHPLPDYDIERNFSIFFTPEYISSDIDSFEVNIIIANLGKATTDSVTVRLKRKLPGSNSPVYYDTTVKYIPYMDTVTFKIPVDIDAGIGKNLLSFYIDYNYQIEEISETNNIIENYELWISSEDLIPVYPYNYAIVPDKNITLKASTGNPLSAAKYYTIQIAENDYYDGSGNFKDTVIYSAGGVVEWPISPSYFKDNTVYYWRCSPADTAKWREASFHIMQNKEGWGESHFYQYKNNNYEYIDYDRPNTEWDFSTVTKTLDCQVVGGASTGADYFATGYYINNELMDYGVCNGTPAIYVAVIDSLTLKPWGTYYVDGNGNVYNPDHQFGNYNNNGACRQRVENYFIFPTTSPSYLDSLADMITNDIPNGNYILAYTARYGYFQSNWSPQHFAAFTNLGASQITSIGDSIPYIFFTKKGDNSTTVEMVGDSINHILKLFTSISGSGNYGNFSTPVFGPAPKWGELHWKQHAKEPLASDSVLLHLYGVDIYGNETYLYTFPQDSTDIFNLYDYIDANTYPYLKFKTDMYDFNNKTAAQYDYIQVYADLMPEAALNYKKHFTFYNDTLQQGEELLFSIAVENISPKNMDSLRIKYWIEDEYRNTYYLNYPKQDSLRKQEILIDTIVYNTKNLSGNCTFWIDVNPEDSLWQLEQYHFNNIARIPFYVAIDKTNPLLDVTFDGIHILDGDIVSPNPYIVIELDDENPFLSIDDTSDISIYITDPQGNKKYIPYLVNGKENLVFTPAQTPENKAKIEYHPVFTQDGTYKLSVQGKDASGNLAGDNEYSISFEVIQKSTITQVLNYPNPFSTSTRFVFVLTGSQIPDVFTIQILTVTGKVVREITREELGDIHIGRNISTFVWDGTDEYGDLLANGVYLYRVIAKINGEPVEIRSSNADNYFHKGFGKMYIMR